MREIAGKFNIILNEEPIILKDLNKIVDMNLRESEDGIVICLLCDKVKPGAATARSAMRAHVETHIDDLHYLCTKCDDKVYRSRSAYNVHYVSHNK